MYQHCRNKIGMNGVVDVPHTTSNLVNSRRCQDKGGTEKCTKMQNARARRAGRAELLFLLIKPIVLWRPRRRRRRLA